MRKIVYATTNPGKFAEVASLFASQGIVIHPSSEFGINLDVEETGSTLEENAILKAEAYRDAIVDDVITLGDDTGLSITALNGEPGIHVRRWKGYKMTDQEIMTYCLERMKNVKEGQRQATFRTVIAVACKKYATKLFSGDLTGEILTEPTNVREEGMPFRAIFNMTSPNHREKAILATLPYLATLQN